MNKISYTEIISSDSYKSAFSGATRGLFSTFLLGPIGLVGFLFGKRKKTISFKVVYENGRVAYKELPIKHYKAKKYIKLSK